MAEVAAANNPESALQRASAPTGTTLRVETAIDPQVCEAGDPLRFTLELEGDVDFSSMSPPVLDAYPVFREHFRIHQEAVQTITRSDRKKYIYTVQPLSAGTYELPPVKVTFYNRQSGLHATARSYPLPVQVNPGKTETEGVTGPGTPLTLLVAPITVDPAGITTVGLPGIKHIAAAALGPVFFLFALFLRSGLRAARRRRAEFPARTAAGRALARLGKAGRRKEESSPEVYAALKGYITERFGLDPESITPADMEEAILKRTGAQKTAERFRKAAEAGFNPEYAPADGGAAVYPDLNEAIEAVKETEGLLRSRSSRSTAVIMLALTTAVFTGFSPEDDFSRLIEERAFIWNEANSLMCKAGGEKDFARAAESYLKLVEHGARNGPLFYNLGTAYLKAGRYEAAERYLRLARRYSGASWEIRRNLALAEAGDKKPAPAVWYGILLWPHHGLSVSVRMYIVSFAFSLLWVLWSVRIFTGPSTVIRRLMAVLIALFVIAGASTFVSMTRL
ncbi:MAG: BatD family protein [Kiritimatiellia bacterium]